MSFLAHNCQLSTLRFHTVTAGKGGVCKGNDPVVFESKVSTVDGNAKGWGFKNSFRKGIAVQQVFHNSRRNPLGCLVHCHRDVDPGLLAQPLQ